MESHDIEDVKASYYVHLDPGLLTQSAAKKWIKSLEATVDTNKDIDVTLKDGFVLCQILNKLRKAQPITGHKTNNPSINFELYNKACLNWDIPASDVANITTEKFQSLPKASLIQVILEHLYALERHAKSKDKTSNIPSLDFRKAASLWRVLSDNKKKNVVGTVYDNITTTNNNNNNNNNNTSSNSNAPNKNFNTWNRSKESPFNSSGNIQAVNNSTIKRKPDLDKSKDDSTDNFFKYVIVPGRNKDSLTPSSTTTTNNINSSSNNGINYEEKYSKISEEFNKLKVEFEAYKANSEETITKLQQQLQSKASADKGILEFSRKYEETIKKQVKQIEDLNKENEVLKREKKNLIDRITSMSSSSVSTSASTSSSSLSNTQSSPNSPRSSIRTDSLRRGSMLPNSSISTSTTNLLSQTSENDGNNSSLVIPEEEGITYDINRGKVEIKGGTVKKLVSKVYTPSETHSVPEYVNTFLLTYRSFATPKEVLSLLVSEYDASCNQKVDEATKLEYNNKRIRICNFLKRWVTDFFNDFDSELVDAYINFTEKAGERGLDKGLLTMLEKAMTKKLQGEISQVNFTFDKEAPASIIPSNSTLIFEVLDPIEIARQLTLTEFELYRSIAPKELVGQNWQSADKEEKSPNVLAMIKRFNVVSNWVTKEILAEPNLKKRQNTLKKFIKICEECHKLNNFNAIFEISSGLSKASVYRLNKTWEVVKGRGTYFDEMEKISSNSGNFKYYKELLRNSNPPSIPYLGVYLSALTFIEDGNPNKFEGTNYINFFKRRLVAEVIKEIQQYQQKPYNLRRVDAIINYIGSEEALREQDAFKISLLLEPRES